MNILQKMSKATDEIGIVEKNLKVSAGAGSYKAVADRDVLDAVKKAEQDNGIFSYPINREIVSQEMPTTTVEYEGKITTKWTVFMRIKTTFRFVNLDDPADFIEVISYGDGVDPKDKAPGKAMTYSDKYALLKAYKIETGDDPDKEGSKQRETTQPKYPPPAPKIPESQKGMKPATDEEANAICTFKTSSAINSAIKAYTDNGVVFNPTQKAKIKAVREALEREGK
jgi:hypothetical protein